MGSFRRCVSIIAYNVNSSPGSLLLGLLSWAPAVQAAELRTCGAGAGRRGWFRPLLRASRVTLPSFPFFLGLFSIWFDSVCIRCGWLDAALWGAIRIYSIGVPAELSRRAPHMLSSRARVVVMQGRGLYTLAAFYAYFAGVVLVLGCSLVWLGLCWWLLVGLRAWDRGGAGAEKVNEKRTGGGFFVVGPWCWCSVVAAGAGVLPAGPV